MRPSPVPDPYYQDTRTPATVTASDLDSDDQDSTLGRSERRRSSNLNGAAEAAAAAARRAQPKNGIHTNAGTPATIMASDLESDDEDSTIGRSDRRRSPKLNGAAQAAAVATAVAARRAQPKKRGGRSVEKQRTVKSLPHEVRRPDGRSDKAKPPHGPTGFGFAPPDGTTRNPKSARQRSSSRNPPPQAERKSTPARGSTEDDAEEGGVRKVRAPHRNAEADKVHQGAAEGAAANGSAERNPASNVRGKRGRGPEGAGGQQQQQAGMLKRVRDGEGSPASGAMGTATTYKNAAARAPAARGRSPGTRGSLGGGGASSPSGVMSARKGPASKPPHLGTKTLLPATAVIGEEEPVLAEVGKAATLPWSGPSAPAKEQESAQKSPASRAPPSSAKSLKAAPKTPVAVAVTETARQRGRPKGAKTNTPRSGGKRTSPKSKKKPTTPEHSRVAALGAARSRSEREAKEGKGPAENKADSGDGDKSGGAAAAEVDKAGAAGKGQKGHGKGKGKGRIQQDRPTIPPAGSSYESATPSRVGGRGKDAKTPRQGSSVVQRTNPGGGGGVTTPGRNRIPPATPDDGASGSCGTVGATPKMKMKPATSGSGGNADATEYAPEGGGGERNNGATRGLDRAGTSSEGGTATTSEETTIYGLKREKKVVIEVEWETETKPTTRKPSVKVWHGSYVSETIGQYHICCGAETEMETDAGPLPTLLK